MERRCDFNFERNSLVIDADACPVARMASKIAKEYGARCIAVCDSEHTFNGENMYGAEIITVSQGADSADFYIVNHVHENDIVITQDYGLAAMCLAKKACVINQNGQIYSDDNISGLLESRAIGKKIRRAGGRTKGPKKRTAEQNDKFEKTLRRLFEYAKGI
ncbi:MAG: YaiI/YqxD family protein [Lachnospiraceae bacterium]|nr:YaiI/YqxD family protein [Lachnospiraceae bacterium]